jgi:hypothetical protein
VTTALNIPCLVLHLRRKNFLAAQSFYIKQGSALGAHAFDAQGAPANLHVRSPVWALEFHQSCNRVAHKDRAVAQRNALN